MTEGFLKPNAKTASFKAICRFCTASPPISYSKAKSKYENALIARDTLADVDDTASRKFIF